ncbi:flagellar basal body rod protein FlgB [Longirhabdus pacifica]|uniref:flagellar basal body rod protein FlgB n=1 Tax=Longirhabdus pacifica TaxID=2305227 RepID=UPI001008F319|nr:flagellar basal body rod protein FlgB [Longirhabdus pacifica]
MSMLVNRNFGIIESSLNAATMRQEVISHNLSNVDTPHYKRSEVVFESVLAEQMKQPSKIVGYKTDQQHLQVGGSTNMNVKPTITVDQHTSFNNNDNNVDVDMEMALMAQNQLRYNVLVEQMSHEVKFLRTSIGGS